MSKRDYYEVLEVARTADQPELKKAYRKLAMQFHPDRNPGDDVAEARFKEAAEAYEVLSNAEKRALYDRFGHEGLRGGGGGGGHAGFSSMDDIFSQFGDIFGDMFGFGGGGGGRRASGGPARGADLRYDLELSFEESAFGTARTIKIPRRTECVTCSGSGAKPGTQPVTCQMCAGRGQIHHSQGFFTLSSTCPQCHGAGKQITDACETCHGQGATQEEKEVSVKVPAGVDTGTRLRLRAEGQSGSRGGPPGDLYVFLYVQPSDVFERDGADLHIRADIPFVQATLGCEFEVPTLGEKHTLVVKPGTQHGDKLTLRNEGLARLTGSGRGDLIVHIGILIPQKLTTEQREILEQFAEVSGFAVKKSGFFDKLKEKIG
ncbi:MAG: molecular chaperone DnaJ [Bradymonadaceae bacterium]|nr:molecular chaperone DnaJ [Lujinxingiaceae bacterium]